MLRGLVFVGGEIEEELRVCEYLSMAYAVEWKRRR